MQMTTIFSPGSSNSPLESVHHLLQWRFSVSGPQPAASGTCGNLIEKQILGPLPRLPEPETLGWSPAESRVLTSPPGVSDASSFENHGHKNLTSESVNCCRHRTDGQ